jgi:hypothetical protein
MATSFKYIWFPQGDDYFKVKVFTNDGTDEKWIDTGTLYFTAQEWADFQDPEHGQVTLVASGKV